MTYQEVEAQALQITPEEQRQLIARLMQNLANRAETAEERRQRLASIPPASALLGIGKADGPPPTDEKICEDYTNYLIQKYLK